MENIQVTEKIISESQRKNSETCAIALSLGSWNGKVMVFDDETYLCNESGSKVEHSLYHSEELTNWIKSYDRGEADTPIQLSVSIENESMDINH